MRSSTIWVHVLALGRERGLVPASSSGRLRVAEALPRGVEERQVGDGPRLCVGPLQRAGSRRASSHGAHRRRYAGTDHRSPTRSVGSSSGHARLRVACRGPCCRSSARRSWSRLDVVVVDLVHQDLEQRVADLVARLVVRRAGLRRLERLGPVVGADPDVRPRRLDLEALRRRPLVEPDGRLDRPHHRRGRLQPGDLRVGLDRRRRHPPRRGPAACTSARPPRRGWAGRRRRSPGTAGAGRRTARRRAGARGAGRSTGGRRCGAGRRRSCRCRDRRRRRARRADPARMIASWSAWMVPSTSRIRVGPVGAQARDERGLVVERGVALRSPLGGEHLVPVVADPPAGPAVAAAAGQPHRVRVGRPEERLGRGRAPVEQQPPVLAVREAEAPDVDGLAVGADDAAEAQVEAEAPQGAQPRGEPVDLLVPLHGRRAPRARGPCARRRAGRTAPRSAARGSPRWPRSAARRGRSGVGSALAARWSGRSKALAVWRVTSEILRPHGGLAARPPARYTLRRRRTAWQ